ncbi:MAG TPA: hypothetical protein VGO37_05680 [Steroidobacteraceae bacterium]|nr:hypothetical protein [Steroidobacteraceae bacterium]
MAFSRSERIDAPPGSQPLITRGKMDLAIGLARAKFGDVKEAVRKRGLVSGRRDGRSAG